MPPVADQPIMTRRPRLDWIDQARGIGILLVVIGHALRGLRKAGLLDETPLLMAIDRGIYAFHMPLFFLLAGLIFLPKAALQPFPAFVADRAKRLIWPLILWTWIFFTLRILAGDYANDVTGWSDFPLLPFPPREHFWFLWALFLILTLGAAALRWPVAALLAVLVMASATMYPDMRAWTEPALRHLPYLIAGIVIARLGLLETARQHTGSAWIAGALLFSVAVGYAALDTEAQPYLIILTVGMSAVIGLVLMISTTPPAGRIGAALRLCGRCSMVIFLTHTIFSSGIRALLESTGVTDPFTHILLGVTLGILGPLVFYRIAARIGARHLLGF